MTELEYNKQNIGKYYLVTDSAYEADYAHMIGYEVYTERCLSIQN